jgi:zinc/manganese transport system substrate-binding protein
MRLLRLSVLAAAVLAVAGVASPSRAAVNVMTTTEDLADLTRQVGGDRVNVESIARGYQDPHFVEAKPSFILLVNRADLLVVVGREMEIGWLPPLITNSRNAKIQPGAAGYLDASLNVRILEIPTGQITRAMGDVHPSGNPHYWLDPDNGRRIAQAVRDKLSELSPNDRAYFAERYTDFDRRLTDGQKRWDAAMAPYKGTKIVTYHRSWPNFADRFIDLIADMKRQQIKIILVEPYFDKKTPDSIARETGAVVLEMPPSVGGVPEATDYIKLFDYDVNLLVAALNKATGK